MDDVLIATDDERLERVFSIMQDMRERLQFVILTCHRERYRGLKNTKFIDIEKLYSEHVADAARIVA